MKTLAIKLLSGKWRIDHPLWNSSRQWLPWAISLTVAGYVVWRMSQEDPAVWREFWPPSPKMSLGIAGALALMPVNWGLEALKWKVLIRPWYQSVSIPRALGLVFCGISTGIFTPNRIGEYPGRIMGLPKGNRWEAATVMLIDRSFQLLMTIWTGSVALCLTRELLPASFQLSELVLWWLMGGLAVGTIVVILCIQNIGNRFHWLPKAVHTAVSQTSPESLGIVFLLSALRNATFTGQFLLLLYAFGLEVPVSIAIGLVWIIFLLKSLVPAWAITELGIRESIAMFVLGLAGVSAPVAFVPTVLLYVINLILPALIGLRTLHHLSWE